MRKCSFTAIYIVGRNRFGMTHNMLQLRAHRLLLDWTDEVLAEGAGVGVGVGVAVAAGSGCIPLKT